MRSTTSTQYEEEVLVTDKAAVVPLENHFFKDWLPLMGILVLHLLLGLVVDRYKSGKPLEIEEIMAR